MRRLARHLFTLCSVASLLLCVAACLVWVRAQSGNDVAAWADVREQPPPSVTWYVFSAYRNGIALERQWTEYSGPGPNRLDTGGPTHFRARRLRPASIPMPVSPPSGWARAGFVLFREQWTDGKARSEDQLIVTAPYWALVLLTLALPGWSLRRALRIARRDRRDTARRCVACGYDLRASPEQCPECGRLLHTSAQARTAP